MIKDGCKLIIFSATFECVSRDTAVHLQLNCVRRARYDAKLGFVPQQYLHRGLAIKSIIHECGPVYGIRVRIVDICPTFTKIKWANDTNCSLPAKEMTVLRDYMEMIAEDAKAYIDNHHELSFQNLLDQVECSDRQRQILLVCFLFNECLFHSEFT